MIVNQTLQGWTSRINPAIRCNGMDALELQNCGVCFRAGDSVHNQPLSTFLSDSGIVKEPLHQPHVFGLVSSSLANASANDGSVIHGF
jgi:hypothetical protein